MTQGNLKFNVSISGSNAEMEWFYTENGVDFAQKGLKLVFENQALKELNDGYFLFKIGSTQVKVGSEEAIQIARNAMKDFTWKRITVKQCLATKCCRNPFQPFSNQLREKTRWRLFPAGTSHSISTMFTQPTLTA